MSNQAMRTACLSVALATAWAPAAEGDILTRIDGDSSMNHGVDRAVVLMGGRGNSIAVRAQAIPGEALTGLTHLTWLGFSDQPTANFGDSFAMIAVGHGSGGGDFLVVTSPGLTYIGNFFDVAFPGYSEQVMIDSLLTDGNAAEQFLRTNFALLLQKQGIQAQCTSFSAGADFGTITFTATSVPAPGAACSLAPLGLLALRRRRGF